LFHLREHVENAQISATRPSTTTPVRRRKCQTRQLRRATGFDKRIFHPAETTVKREQNAARELPPFEASLVAEKRDAMFGLEGDAWLCEETHE
jgi:hypothetical protein